MSAASGYGERYLHWQGLSVTVRYLPVIWHLGGIAVAHLEVVSTGKCPLPFTETGYKSQFITQPSEDFYPADYVCCWLDHAAQCPDWKASQAAARQGSLF